MSKEFLVILAKANWCSHCQQFEPIFQEAEKQYKSNKYLKKYDIKFKDYDMATKEGKNNFAISHLGALNMVDAYPTVIVGVHDKEKKNTKYYTVSHTVEDNKNNDNDSNPKKEASERFLNNINNLIKSINSDGKVVYMQTGGFNDKSFSNHQTLAEDSIYREKYLKYKTKYMKLKNK